MRVDNESATPIIHVADARKSFVLGKSRIEALRGVDLTLDEPGFYGIMGASGSGKSTLLHLLAGLDRPDSGEVVVDGCRLHELPESDLTRFRRHRVGIVFQSFNLIPTLSALANATLPGMLDGMSKRERLERGHQLLASLNLTDRGHHRPDALSGGEQQRVAIARALLFSPRVLLADEPTGNLDSQTSEQLWNLLGRLAGERNMTVLMVTHEPAAAAHCRRVYVLRDGRIEGEIDVEGIGSGELAARYQQFVGAGR